MVTERDTLTNEEIERILEEIRGVINGPEISRYRHAGRRMFH